MSCNFSLPFLPDHKEKGAVAAAIAKPMGQDGRAHDELSN